MQAPVEESSTDVLVLVHGIRTEAAWAEMVATVFQKEFPDLELVPVRYGYFDAVRFWLPILTRSAPVSRLARELRAIRARRLFIIAHSFGTYTVGRVLANEADIKIDRLVLCGSVLPQDFRWDLVAHRIGDRVVNDCGIHDVWPLLAAGATWGYGPSGTFGFGTAKVRDRYHPFGHSGFFTPKFVSEYWVPFFRDGAISSGSIDGGRPTPPLWQSLLSRLPFRWFLTTIVLVVIWLVFFRPSASDRLERQMQGHASRWEIIRAAQGKASDEGRDRALVDLVKDGVSLRGIQLAGAFLREIELPGADLSQARLDSANLYLANLDSTDLRDAHLKRADMTLVSLRGAEIGGANLSGARLIGAHLEHADIRDAILDGANLGAAYLAHARLVGASLRATRLAGSELLWTNFNGATIDWADLRGARIEPDAILRNVKSAQGANVAGLIGLSAKTRCWLLDTIGAVEVADSATWVALQQGKAREPPRPYCSP